MRRLTLLRLECRETEDDLTDHLRMELVVDGVAQTPLGRSGITPGQTWNIDRTFPFEQEVLLELWEKDTSLFDPDDLLGELRLRHSDFTPRRTTGREAFAGSRKVLIYEVKDYSYELVYTVESPNQQKFLRTDFAPWDYSKPMGTPAMSAGASYRASARVKNDGTSTWQNTGPTPYRLGAWQDVMHWGVNRVDLPKPVAPGETIDLEWTFTAPQAPGEYPWIWSMVQEHVEWFEHGDGYRAITVFDDPPPLIVSVEPAVVPLDRQVQMVVRAVNSRTGDHVQGTVRIDGQTVGSTGTAFAHTFRGTRRTEYEFDPVTKRRRWWTYVDPPNAVVGVHAGGYPEATAPVRFR